MQRATTGLPHIAQSIVDDAAWPSKSASRSDHGSIGVVVGATSERFPTLARWVVRCCCPGVGAQGGRPEALAGLGGAQSGTLLPAVSREVLRAGPDFAAVRRAGGETS